MKFEEREYVIYFVKGLNESYNNVRNQILVMDPIPSINKAFAMANQQETHPHVPSAKTLAFTLNSTLTQSHERSQQGASRGRGRNGPRKPMLCTYYKKTNHATENCYFKHGFPPSQKTRNQRNTLQLSTETSTATKNVQHQNSNSADSFLHLSQDDYCNIHKIFNEIKK